LHIFTTRRSSDLINYISPFLPMAKTYWSTVGALRIVAKSPSDSVPMPWEVIATIYCSLTEKAKTLDLKPLTSPLRKHIFIEPRNTTVPGEHLVTLRRSKEK